jgi:pimeloyl-ACP methyl ester carboxylesterase
MTEPVLTRQEIEATRLFESGRENTLDRGRATPIVFVPGVMGSRLRFAAHNESWDPDSTMNMLGWARKSAERAAQVLSVRAGDVGEVMSDPISYDARLVPIWNAVDPARDRFFYGRQRGWGGAAKDFYRELLTSLEVRFNSAPFVPGQHPVYAFGYDWRKSNANSGALLARRVRHVLEKHGASKVILVTHSMGGLVARAACSPGGSGIASLVKGVVHVVQPVNGAVVAYRRFAEGLDGDRVGLEGRVMAEILGGTWWGYSMIMSGTDGPLQLLPNQLYPNWLTLPNGERMVAARTYDFYTSGSAQSLLRPLSSEDIQAMKYRGMGASPNPREGANEAWAVSMGGSEAIARVEAARAQRIQAKWTRYQALLRVGLERARAYHAVVGGYAHRRTAMLYAGGLSTEVGYDWTRPNRRITNARGGDATVPIASAQALDRVVADAWGASAPPRLPVSVDVGAQEHSAVFGHGSTRDLVMSWINALRLLPDG